jgi:magnesium transporter
MEGSDLGGSTARQATRIRLLPRKRSASLRVVPSIAAARGDRLLKTYRTSIDDLSKIDGQLPDDAIWIDLLDPTDGEKRSVEHLLGIKIPSKAALSEIEASSRLISDRGKLYLSTPAVSVDAQGDPHLTPLGFIIDSRVLVTIRFSVLPIFDSIVKRLETDETLQTGTCVFAALLEALVDRGADVLEQLGIATDVLSKQVFKGGLIRSKKPVRSSRRLREALQQVGELADKLARARDVLLGVQRIAAFAGDVSNEWMTPSAKKRLDSVSKDVISLSDYETRLSDKIQLLLDAVLGFINIQQNDLFKILTIVSVVGVPPTILVGVWGMNFKTMPELNWTAGYPLALLAIIASGLLPLLWFRQQGWFD